MSELHRDTTEVAVVFHQGTSLLIPPTGLARETRRAGELYEKTLHRLLADHDISAPIDLMIPGLEPTADEVRTLGYLVEPRNGELDRSELFVEQADLQSHLVYEVEYSRIDHHLVTSAYFLLQNFRRR